MINLKTLKMRIEKILYNIKIKIINMNIYTLKILTKKNKNKKKKVDHYRVLKKIYCLLSLKSVKPPKLIENNLSQIIKIIIIKTSIKLPNPMITKINN